MNPYTILGISPDATDDEVKKAYRKLSKKYHPDANIGSSNQEAYTEKFKQVQNAYKTIMDQRKNGYSSSSSFYGQQQSYSGAEFSSDQEAYNEAYGFMQANRFQEAMDVLDSIRVRNDVWFYYAAIAQNGLGNRIAAIEYAKTAYSMNPSNLQYMLLLQQLQSSTRAYTQTSTNYGRSYNLSNCCYTYLLLQCLCGGFGGARYGLLCC